MIRLCWSLVRREVLVLFRRKRCWKQELRCMRWTGYRNQVLTSFGCKRELPKSLVGVVLWLGILVQADRL